MMICPICGKAYRSRSGLWAHKRRKHSGLPVNVGRREMQVIEGSNPVPHRKIQVCNNCPALSWCRVLIRVGYILCEVVDVDQLARYRANGVDLGPVIGDQRLRHQIRVLDAVWRGRW